MSFRVNIARAESRFVGRVFRVVIRVSERLGSGTISARGGVESIVRLGDETLIEAGRGHLVLELIESFLQENVSGLLSESLLQQRVGSNLGSVALIAGQDVVLALTRLELHL